MMMEHAATGMTVWHVPCIVPIHNVTAYILQCWGLIFSNFTAQAHAANVWVNPKAPDADGLVVDRHFLQAHWYLLLIW